MNTALIIGIVVFFLIAFLIIKLIKKVISLIFSIVGLVILIAVILFILAAVDKANLADGLSNSNNLFILEDNGRFITAYDSMPFSAYNSSELQIIDESFKDESSKKEFLANRYRIITVNMEAITSLDLTSIDADGTKYLRSEALNLMRNNDDYLLRAQVFKAIVDSVLLKDKPEDSLVDLAKDEKIDVFERTIAFKRFFLW
jgi:hypothetical protein